MEFILCETRVSALYEVHRPWPEGGRPNRRRLTLDHLPSGRSVGLSRRLKLTETQVNHGLGAHAMQSSLSQPTTGSARSAGGGPATGECAAGAGAGDAAGFSFSAAFARAGAMPNHGFAGSARER